MEGTRAIVTDFVASPLPMSSSPKSSAASEGSQACRVVEKDLKTCYLQGKGTDDFDIKVQQQLPDSSTVGNESMNKSINTSDKLSNPDVPSQHAPVPKNLDSHPQYQGAVDKLKPLVLYEVPDTSTFDKNNSSILPVAPICLPGIVSGSPSHYLQTSEEELGSISHDEHETSVKVDAILVNNGSSACTESTTIEQRPTMLPFGLNHMKNPGNTKNSSEEDESFKHRKDDDDDGNINRHLINTTTRVESVKEIVTKFGGIVDWKAHKAHSLEKHKHIISELERIQEEIAECRRQTEAAEVAKVHVQKELKSTKQMVEELQLKIEGAQREEIQAQQDSKLAQLRAREMEQGIGYESSTASKRQLEVAKERYEAAVAERKLVEEELKALRGQCVSLIRERDISMRKYEEFFSVAKEIEKRIDELSLLLISKKGSLESALATYTDAEESRFGVALVRDQDCLTWEKELKQAEEEVQQINQQLITTKDLKLKLVSSSALLLRIKDELAVYMKSKLKQESETIDDVEKTEITLSSIQALEQTKKALIEVKISIEKTETEVNHLKDAASCLKTELDQEKIALTILKQREGIASIVVSSLETEIDRIEQELEAVQKKEKEAREKMVELPKLLPAAAKEADQAKSFAQKAQEELRKVKKECEQVKAAATIIQIKLLATSKGFEAAKASEKLALEAVNALQESEKVANMDGETSPAKVTLSLDDYLTLSKKVKEAEMLSQGRVAAVLTQIEVAKESEAISLKRLEEAYVELLQRKQAMEVAINKAEKAKDEKLVAEQELRKWSAELKQQRKASISPVESPRAELEEQRKANEKAKIASSHLRSPSLSLHQRSDQTKDETDAVVHPKPLSTEHGVLVKKKKKKSLFLKIALFVVRLKR